MPWASRITCGVTEAAREHHEDRDRRARQERISDLRERLQPDAGETGERQVLSPDRKRRLSWAAFVRHEQSRLFRVISSLGIV